MVIPACNLQDNKIHALSSVLHYKRVALKKYQVFYQNTFGIVYYFQSRFVSLPNNDCIQCAFGIVASREDQF